MSEEIKIESGIPVPVGPKNGHTGCLTRTILAMQVGDSFLLEDANKIPGVRTVARYNQIKILTRVIRDGDKKQFRVWRIE